MARLDHTRRLSLSPGKAGETNPTSRLKLRGTFGRDSQSYAVRAGGTRGRPPVRAKIVYRLFRFAHEFLRDTARAVAPVSGYQIIALYLAAFGAWAFRRRAAGLGLQGTGDS